MPKMPSNKVIMVGLLSLIICVVIGSFWIGAIAAVVLFWAFPHYLEKEVVSSWNYSAQHKSPIKFNGKEYYLIKK